MTKGVEVDMSTEENTQEILDRIVDTKMTNIKGKIEEEMTWKKNDDVNHTHTQQIPANRHVKGCRNV